MVKSVNMSLTEDVLGQALALMDQAQYYGTAQTSTDPVLRNDTAIQAVNNDLNSFRTRAQSELAKWPLVDKFFGSLIRHRLQQDDPLASRFIRTLFFTGPVALEDRLSRIQHIQDIEQVTVEVGLPQAATAGAETDELILDGWAEALVADVLLRLPDVQRIEKVVRPRNRPAVDFMAISNGDYWIVESTRLRKKDFDGETYSSISPECEDPKNVAAIQSVLANKLNSKEDQLARFIQSEGTTFTRQVVAVKTSQEAYQDCKDVIAREAKNLLSTGSYPSITHLLLIPDVASYEFVEK